MLRLTSFHQTYPKSAFLILFALSATIYWLVFSQPFPLNQLYSLIPPLDYAKLSNYNQLAFIAYLLGIVILFGLYWWATGQNWPVWVPYSGAGFALILFFAYPVLAIDLFVYAIWSRGWALYGLNPLATAPANFPASDRWLGLAAEWINASSPYGPLWEAFSRGAFNLSGGNFLSHLFLLKGMAIISYLIAIFLIGAIAQTLHPDYKVAAMMAFAWNPLVLLETAQNGHNDMLMVVFLLAAILALVKKKDYAVIPLLALSVLVKFITILVAPFFILYLALKARGWPGRIAAFVVHSLVLAVIIILPMRTMWPGLDNWAVLQAGRGAGRSVIAALVLSLRGWLGTNTAFDAARWIVLLLFAAICLGYLWHSRKKFHNLATPIYLSWAVLFWYVALAAPVFHGWYILWFLPLGALLIPTNPLPLRASIIFSFTALLVIPYWETVRIWYPYLLRAEPLGHLLGLSILLIPPALAVIWPLVSFRRSTSA